ncbi:MAG: hypothetical protein H7Y04_13305 [Verrucomicrobia bacterium]|nr:hypothetical protein [Cytophagales bacterium]
MPRHTKTKEELEEYEYARMRETDEIAREMFVEEKTRDNERKEIAKKMLKRGTAIEIIAEDTGLTLEQIQELQATLER